MDYVKLNPKAEKCMRVNEIIKDVILLAAALVADFIILWERSYTACLLTGAALLVMAAVCIIIIPRIRYERYRYIIDSANIRVREGIFWIKETMNNGRPKENNPGAILEHAGAVIPVLLVFVSAAYGLIKKYIIYYNFRVYRDGDDLHLRYGLLKLKNYTVPIDKISAVEIVQPTLSRIFKRYQAKIVTVGVGDEGSELSNLTMAVSKEELLHQLDVLIPEFMGESILDGMCSESRKGVAVRAVKSVKWIIIIVVGAVVTGLLTDLPTWTLALCAAGLLGFIFLLYGLSHISAGWKKGEQALVLMQGCFTKSWTVCRYDKIQMVNLVAHPAARPMGIKRGTVHMLQMVAEIPYMKDEQAEAIAAAVV